MEEKKVTRIAFYMRVSTPEEKKSGFGVDFQLNAFYDLMKYKSNQEPKWITNEKWIYDDGWFSW